jgi:hypothetical protein
MIEHYTAEFFGALVTITLGIAGWIAAQTDNSVSTPLSAGSVIAGIAVIVSLLLRARTEDKALERRDRSWAQQVEQLQEELAAERKLTRELMDLLNAED